MNVNTDGLPPEMQARIAQIIQNAKANVADPRAGTPTTSAVPEPQAPAPAPIQRPPSLLDHTVSLRQEVAQLRQQVAAMAQVTDAVGQAVGQIYGAFFQEQQAATYSSAFQAQATEPVSYTHLTLPPTPYV